MKLLVNLCAHDGIISHYEGVGTIVRRYVEVIRKILSDFEGCIISVSHDRKYIEEVCDKIYELTKDGLIMKHNL